MSSADWIAADFVESADELIRPDSQNPSGSIPVGAPRRPAKNVSNIIRPSSIDRAGENLVGNRVVELEDERHGPMRGSFSTFQR